MIDLNKLKVFKLIKKNFIKTMILKFIQILNLKILMLIYTEEFYSDWIIMAKILIMKE